MTTRALRAQRYYRAALAQGGWSPRETARLTERLANAERQLVGCCRECGHPLTDPESVATGIGPDCAARLARTA